MSQHIVGPNAYAGAYAEAARIGQQEFEHSEDWTMADVPERWHNSEARGVREGAIAVVCNVDPPPEVRKRTAHLLRTIVDPTGSSLVFHNAAYAVVEKGNNIHLTDNMRAAAKSVHVYKAVRDGDKLVWQLQEKPPKWVISRLGTPPDYKKLRNF